MDINRFGVLDVWGQRRIHPDLGVFAKDSKSLSKQARLAAET